jgi:CubicO group peptidase (beta-lactamase class C family)
MPFSHPSARFLLLLLVSLGLASGGKAAGLDVKAVDALVHEAMTAWCVPGVAVAIVRDGEVVYLKGYGVRAAGTKDQVTPDTLFPIASCTKAFTTTAMAILVDEGKLGWDDPVRRHVPYFHLADPKADALVTLRDLVCHRTGLRGHDLLWYRSPWSQEEIIRRAGRLPLDKPFRGAFQYQSTMFTAAGKAVAAASGMPWADFVQKRLLDPLDMTGAVLTTTAMQKVADHASPHRLNQRNEPEAMAPYPIEAADPAGSLHASSRDMAKWLIFQLGDGSAGGRRIVSARQLTEMHTPQVDIPIDRLDRQMFPETRKMSYGLGWVLMDHRGHNLVSHAGAIDGFRAHMTMVPESHLGIVLLNNLHHTRMNIALSNGLLDLLLGMPKKDWNAIVKAAVQKEQAASDEADRERLAKRRPDTRPSLDPAAYAGSYEHPAYGRVQVTAGPGGLVWQWNDFRATTLEHFHFDTFTLPIEIMGEPEVVFVLEGGAVTRMKVGGNMDVEFRRLR